MTTAGAGAARWLAAAGLLAVPAVVPGTAHAYWSADGTAVGQATVASLAPLAVDAVTPALSDEVSLSWTAPPLPGALEVQGFVVDRSLGGGPWTPVCGTHLEPLAAGATGCTDALLPDGVHDYRVTALLGSWTTQGTASVTVQADRSGPEVVLRVEDADSAALDDEAVLYLRGGASGGFRVSAEVTDSGVGPGEVEFPAVADPGWVHDAETVSTGTGGTTTRTYLSSAFAFPAEGPDPAEILVRARDLRGNETVRALRVVRDADAPTGGLLRVNGTDATAAGSTSVATGGVTIESMTPFAETPTADASGIDRTVLVRESAPLSSGSCGAFDGRQRIDASLPVTEPALPDGCYRYTLIGRDRVGNEASVSTTVVVDTSAPEGGILTVNGTAAAPGGSLSLSRTGTWTADRADFTDLQSGMAASTLVRTRASLSNGACGAFDSPVTVGGAPAEAGLATGCYRYRLTGTNAVGLTAEIDTTVRVDSLPPSGGAMLVNGVAASAAGSSSTSVSRSITVVRQSEFTDAESGLAGSEVTVAFADLAAGSCGTFGAEQGVVGTGTITIADLADGCHRFTLTGTDLAGNTAVVRSVVRVDASAPTGGTLVVNGVAADATMTRSYAGASPISLVWTPFADAHSGIASNAVLRTRSSEVIAAPCATFSPSSFTVPAAGTTGSVPLPTSGRCYRFTLTGTDAFGNRSAISTEVWFDSSAPGSTGSLTVNGTTGSSSTSSTGTFAVTTLRTFADAESGIASTVLTRTWAPVTSGTCGAFDGSTTVTLDGALPIGQEALPVGCYRFTQTGTNGVGRSASVSTTVRVDSTAPTGGVLVANGTTATEGAASLSWSTTGAWTTERVDFTDPESTLTSSLTRSVTTSLVNGSCGSFGGTTTRTGAPVESGVATGCVRYVLTGRNSLNLTTAVTTIVRVDRSAPTGGALTVNGVAATTAGSTSTSGTGTFAISRVTAFADSHSGMAGSTLSRTWGPTCDQLDPDSTVEVTGAAPLQETSLPAGCYAYALTGTNTLGLTSVVTTSVVVGP